MKGKPGLVLLPPSICRCSELANVTTSHLMRRGLWTREIEPVFYVTSWLWSRARVLLSQLTGGTCESGISILPRVGWGWGASQVSLLTTPMFQVLTELVPTKGGKKWSQQQMLMKGLLAWATGETKQQYLPGYVSKDLMEEGIPGARTGGLQAEAYLCGCLGNQQASKFQWVGENVFGHWSLIGWVLISSLPATSCVAENKQVNP